MAKTALLTIIKVLHKDESASIDALTVAFTEDYGHFARANNRESLEQAAKVLTRSKIDQAIAHAIHAGYKAGGLAVGYVGARTGKFKDQPENVQQEFNSAIDRACEAFRSSLTESGVFVTKTRTEEEKTKAKAEKAEKAEAAITAAIDARIVSGELVRSADIRPVTLADIGQSETVDFLCTAILAGTIDPDNLVRIVQVLRDAGAVPPLPARKATKEPAKEPAKV